MGFLLGAGVAGDADGGGVCWMLPKVRVPWAMYRLLLPLVSPLPLGVAVVEGVVGCVPILGAVGVTDGEGAAVVGSGCRSGRGWPLGGAGRGPSPLLRAWWVALLVGLPVCPSGASGVGAALHP